MLDIETAQAGRSTGSFGHPDDKLFRIHFDNLPRPAYIWRRDRSQNDWVLIAYNNAAGSLRYSDVESLVGRTVTDLQRGSYIDMRADLERSAERGVIVNREAEYRYIASGTVRKLAISMVPLSKDIVVLHTEDITERRATEDALRESEQKYRTIVDTAHEGIVSVDMQSTINYANQRAAEMLGYEPAECVGRKTFEFMDLSVHEQARSIRQRLHGGNKEREDIRLRHKSGDPVWVSAAATPLLDPLGKVTGVIYMLTDITERRQAEQALRESEARVRALLGANPDLIVRLTRDGLYLDVHSTDPRMDHHEPKMTEFIGRYVHEMFEPEFAREHERRRFAALETGEMQLWEYVRPDPRGSVRHIEARFVKSGENEVVVTVRDFTQRVELEREVIASSERERARIGHDLHDGLAQLLIGVKLLLAALEDKLVAAKSPYGELAERATDLVSRAIAQTADLAQGLSPIPKRGRLSDSLRKLASQSEQLLGVPCEVVSADTPRGLSESAATHLYRIAQEAITNAAKHGRATRIRISCEWTSPRLVLSVADDGRGFDPRLDSGGMGIHIMQYRARNIGADFSIKAQREGGTVVRCSAPVADAK
jgi:PAS domain S-box-containing protein